MDRVKSIEDYLMDMINQRYARRVFSKLATEHEKNFMDLGKNPDYKEYEWMVARAMEIHRTLNMKDGKNEQEKQD